MTTKKDIGRTCARAREAKGWTINRTATESGLKGHQIQGIEEGSTAYTLDSLLVLCEVLDLSVRVGEQAARG